MTERTVTESPQRSPIERQLNVGLMIVMVIAVLIVVYGVTYAVTNDRTDRPQFEAIQIAVVFLILPGTVVFFTAKSARRRLKAQVVSAKLFSILAGVFAMLAGLPLVSTVFGLVSVVAGLFTLTAAFLLKKDQLA